MSQNTGASRQNLQTRPGSRKKLAVSGNWHALAEVSAITFFHVSDLFGGQGHVHSMDFGGNQAWDVGALPCGCLQSTCSICWQWAKEQSWSLSRVSTLDSMNTASFRSVRKLRPPLDTRAADPGFELRCQAHDRGLQQVLGAVLGLGGLGQALQRHRAEVCRGHGARQRHREGGDLRWPAFEWGFAGLGCGLRVQEHLRPHCAEMPQGLQEILIHHERGLVYKEQPEVQNRVRFP